MLIYKWISKSIWMSNHIILYIVIFWRGKKINLSYWKYALPICLPFIPHLLSLTVLNSMDKTIMRLLGRILESDSKTANSKMPRILPALRLSVVLLCILLCSLSRNAIFVVAILAAELLRLAFLPPLRTRK